MLIYKNGNEIVLCWIKNPTFKEVIRQLDGKWDGDSKCWRMPCTWIRVLTLQKFGLPLGKDLLDVLKDMETEARNGKSSEF